MRGSKACWIELGNYQITLAAMGAAIILAYWMLHLFSGREPTECALLICAVAAHMLRWTI